MGDLLNKSPSKIMNAKVCVYRCLFLAHAKTNEQILTKLCTQTVYDQD